jgi:hypothetical protein
MTTVRVVDEPHAAEGLKQLVRDHLDLYNVAVTGLADYAPVSIFLNSLSSPARQVLDMSQEGNAP